MLLGMYRNLNIGIKERAHSYSHFSLALILFFSSFASFANEEKFLFSFKNQALFFENADFQSYEEESFRDKQASRNQNTDDTYKIVYGELSLLLEKEYKNSTFYIQAARAAHWGADNFQGRDEGQNSVYFKQLYFRHRSSSEFEFSLGRQRYEIGDSYWDYFFSDIIDGLSFLYRSPADTFSINFMGDVLSNSVPNEETGIYGVVKKDEESIDDFRGDTLSSRAGLNLRIGKTKKSAFPAPFFGLRAFSYHLRYGVSSQGSADLAESGKNPYNKSDGDFLNTSGLRFYASLFKGSVDMDFTWAHSRGRDLQFASEHIYDDSAYALNFLWKENWERKEKAPIQNEFALQAGLFEPRFAGMKGLSMGGMLLWGYKSYQTAPYAAPYHFRDYAKWKDSPLFIDRTNPKTFFKLKEKLRLGNFSSSLSYLRLMETESRDYMGSEIEFALEYSFDNIKFTQQSAVFIPSDYYQRRSIENKFIPAGKDRFYALRFSLEYLFDLKEGAEEGARKKKRKKPQKRKRTRFSEEKYSYD